MRTNVSKIYCPEVSCLYASGYIQVSRFKIFEGKFYGCPSYLRYIGAVLNIDKEIFDSSIQNCEEVNSCIEVNYKLPTIPDETIIDMTICCNSSNNQKLYDTPPILTEPCNSNFSIKMCEQFFLPFSNKFKNNSSKDKKTNNFIILLLILIFLNI
ncbi:Hypothetical protein SRAE_2000068000 [Strongyloides ratti]|uniref:Uncharacterized protein n=1 Tax=Strongyloides ratti TaxID=34506 RepID=A0A090L8C7_STRRB|nr:Hypothetical protein SRAE_2000068000 [Strongyloides ratti]CEF66007.1 Hypothetical protein SRAE_2000068000 [Strongyloides ratti]